MKKKGISLITLIITIIVIIILAGVIIFSLTNNNPANKANEAVFKQNMKTYSDELEMYHINETARTTSYDSSDLNKTSSNIQEVIKSMKDKDVEKFEIQSGKLVYVGEDEEEKKWAEDILIGKSDKTEEEKKLKVNEPQLVAGMTPIVWDESGNVVEITKDDENWYDYENKKWANAKTADGSMWVWIPRYEYKEFTKGSEAQVIDVNFIEGTSKTATSGYITHPGFTFGSEELPGIWVAKFEASGSTSAVAVKPGVASLINITIDAMFTASLNMKDGTSYGWSTDKARIDTHLMKNVEWGAVAYLSSSKYGKTGEVTINNNSSFYTGGGTGNAYTTNVGQSTTGTVYGVYDMSGGAYEYTAAYVDNGDSNLTTYGNSLVKADEKYKDVYAKGGEDTREANYGANSSKKGDAVYETSSKWEGSTSWYGDFSYMPYSYYPFFERGGYYSSGTYAGVFNFYYGNGYDNSNDSFRPVLAVSVAL